MVKGLAYLVIPTLICLTEVYLLSSQGLFLPSAVSLAVPLALMSLTRLKVLLAFSNKKRDNGWLQSSRKCLH